MKYFALLLSLVVLASCQSATRRAKLEENVRTYFLALRRADQAAVVSYVHPDKQQSFYENVLKLDDVHISHAVVETIFPDEDLETALVSARLEFFSPNSSSLQTWKRKFAWKYHPEAKTWLLEEDQPFGSQLVSN